MEIIRAAFERWMSGGSRAALVRLLEVSQVLIFGVCFEVLRHRHDAEDATQRVLLEIQKGMKRVVDAEHYLHRLRLIAFRTALDTRRDRRRRVDRERKAADMIPPTSLTEDVREAIHEAMSALDEESRALVLEHYFEKATLDAMAARRGVTAAAIWKRIQGIKNRLREGLVLAGLASAASKAEACIESAALVAPSANMVTGVPIAGGFMATKTTAAAATFVATLTFALGLGGGLAIQAARDPMAPHALPVVRNEPPDRLMVSKNVAALPTTKAPVDPVTPIVEAVEDRLKIAREIWAQFSRPRFWKDPEARDETLPKLKLLRPDQAEFFISRFRDPEVKEEQKREAIRLAVTCGGPQAAAFLLELLQAPDSDEARRRRLSAYVALQSGFDSAIPDLPLGDELKSGAMALLNSTGWDRALGRSILACGPPADWMPIVTEAVRSDPSGLMRSEAVKLLALRGGPDALAFLKEQKEAIRSVPPDSRYGAGAASQVESEKDRLGRVVDDAIAELERRLKK